MQPQIMYSVYAAALVAVLIGVGVVYNTSSTRHEAANYGPFVEPDADEDGSLLVEFASASVRDAVIKDAEKLENIELCHVIGKQAVFRGRYADIVLVIANVPKKNIVLKLWEASIWRLIEPAS